MAGADNRVPLLLRTAQTLRERFAALRSAGSVEAVMEESPSNSETERERRQATLPFRAEGETELRWWDGCHVERGDELSTFRSVWLGCDSSLQRRLLQICREANGFVPFVRAKYGLPKASYTYLDEEQWIWTVFELAEARVPFTVLALGKRGEVFRYSERGQSWAAESHIEAGRSGRYSANQFLQHIGGLEYGPSRYWHLPDLIEASIAVMDIIEVAIPSLGEEPEEEPPAGDGEPTAEGGDEEPEDTTKGKRGRPHKRTIIGGLEENVAAAYAKDPARRYWSSYELAKVVPFAESTIRTRCVLYKATRAAVEAEAADKAEQAEAELASRNIEDEGGNGLHRSSTKSRVGRERGDTSKQRELKREADRLLAAGKRPRKRQK